MPRGVRSERISERDLEVLGLIGRFGVVPRRAVSLWAGTGRTVTQSRERRLRIAGLLEVHPALGQLGPFSIATRAGLRACGLEALRPAALSYGELHHSAACALVGARLERAGETVLSERELAMAERLAGERLYSARLARGSHHRPDLIRLASEGPEAIEVELTPKAPRRLDELIRAWRRAALQRKAGSILYLCSAEAVRGVERAIERTLAQGLVRAERLERDPGAAASPRLEGERGEILADRRR